MKGKKAENLGNKQEKNKKQKVRPKMDLNAGQQSMEVTDYESGLKSAEDLKPGLFWPVYSRNDGGVMVHEEKQFPEINELNNSLSVANAIEHSKNETIERYNSWPFWNALFKSCNVYIVDKFFSMKEFQCVQYVVTKKQGFDLKKLTIICSNDCVKLREAKRSINGKNKIEIHVYSMPPAKHYDIHDRFAWMDGEIWHFGSTVGGIKPHVTAYSRGWYDYDCRFRKYIDRMIAGQSD